MELKGLLVCVLSLISIQSCAQNNGFEGGLTGWTVKGNVGINRTNTHSGAACVYLSGGNSSVFKWIDGLPLAIVSYNSFVKTSDTLTKAYTFIRFLDAQNKELLTYKSSAIRSTDYKESGNYTETPVGTRYIEIGVESDAANKGDVFADDFKIENNLGEPKVKHDPQVNLDQYMHPFWKSDTIYNETVLLYSVNGAAANGKLLYTPDKILSVQKFDLSATFKDGTDYTLNGNVITRTANSAMPFWADTSFDKKDLGWYNIQSQWVVITYTHHDNWDGLAPVYKGDNMPHVMAKLKAGSPLKIAAYGMSITRGLDVSSYDDVPPYMPTYVSLFARQLGKAYRNKNVKLYNAGLPGSVVDWGAQYADKYIVPLKADLVILDFGMNDFWRMPPEEFKGHIVTIIQKLQKANPKVEIMLLSNLKFDPDYVLDSDKNKAFYQGNMIGYSKVLKDLEAPGIINLDMTTISDAIYARKKAKDCIANPLHPNDYLARWYAQGMSQLLIQNYK